MKNPVRAAVLAIAALSVSACSGGPVGHVTVDDAAASSPAVSEISPTPTTEAAEAPHAEMIGATPELEAWVTRKHDLWVEAYSETSPSSDHSILIFQDVTYDTVWMDNLSWEARRCGEIVITARGNKWSKLELERVSGFVLPALARTSPELQVVTATTEDGKTKSIDRRSADDFLRPDGNPGGTCNV